MLELLKQVPNGEKLLEIKGVGLITAATFVGEVGDISRFQDPCQIQKLREFLIFNCLSPWTIGQGRLASD